jgi:hypothetical protein
VVRSLICSTVLGTHPEIKVNNCPFVSLWGQVGVVNKLPMRGRDSDPNMAALIIYSNNLLYSHGYLIMD